MDDRLHTFRVDREPHGDDLVVLVPRGDLDIFAAPAFKEVLLESIGEGCPHVVVDLTAAPFIDSTGLGVLVSGAKKARRGTLAVVCDDEATLRVFDIVGFDRLFAVYRSRTEALTALAFGDDVPDAVTD